MAKKTPAKKATKKAAPTKKAAAKPKTAPKCPAPKKAPAPKATPAAKNAAPAKKEAAMATETKPLTPNERKRAEHDRYRKLGRVVMQVWVHPEDRERVRAYTAKLNKAWEDPNAPLA